MLERIGATIFAPEAEDKKLCQLAAEASSDSKPLLHTGHPEMGLFVDELWAERVLKGLAKISLRPRIIDCHSISPAEADYWLGELSGSVEGFFYPILQKHK